MTTLYTYLYLSNIFIILKVLFISDTEITFYDIVRFFLEICLQISHKVLDF